MITVLVRKTGRWGGRKHVKESSEKMQFLKFFSGWGQKKKVINLQKCESWEMRCSEEDYFKTSGLKSNSGSNYCSG